MSTLRLVGAAFVAFGVLCELVGELVGRNSEQTLEIARDAELERLVGRVETMTTVGSPDDRSPTREAVDEAALRMGGRICPRTGRVILTGRPHPL